MKELMEHGGLAYFGEELEERQIFKQGTVFGVCYTLKGWTCARAVVSCLVSLCDELGSSCCLEREKRKRWGHLSKSHGRVSCFLSQRLVLGFWGQRKKPPGLRALRAGALAESWEVWLKQWFLSCLYAGLDGGGSSKIVLWELGII